MKRKLIFSDNPIALDIKNRYSFKEYKFGRTYRENLFKLTKHKGFTLIELMVSMVVGMVICAGAATLFANTLLTTRSLGTASVLNESGARINNILARHLRMTGYIDWLSSQSLYINTIKESNSASYNLKQADMTTVFQSAFATALGKTVSDIPQPLSGCDAGVYANPTTFTNSDCVNASTGMSALTTVYQVSSTPESTYAPSMRQLVGDVTMNLFGMGGDCNNQQASTLYAVNRFYLRATTTTEATTITGEPPLYDLMCQGNSGGTAQPLANNIEQWVLTYGVPGGTVPTDGSASNDLQVARYLTATQVTTEKIWNQVISVRSCILIAGDRNSAPALESNTKLGNRKDCLNNFVKVGAERRLRQAFTQTITLRNQIHTAN